MRFPSRFIIPFLVIATFQALGAVPDTLEVGKKYASIKQALAAAASGDVIKVFPGVYFENEVIIDKPCTLLGVGYPILDAGLKNDAIIIRADSVSIIGFHIRNVATNYVRDLAAIHVEEARHFNIQDNKLENTFFGIYLQKSRDGRVAGNSIIGQAVVEASSGNAIHLWYCKNVDVSNNEARHHRDGIYLEFSDSIRIVRNVSQDNLRYGLHFMFSNYNDYLENTFQSNGAGVAVMFSSQIVMKRNRFIDNWGSASYGILLKEIKDGLISNNLFQGNTIGIYGESSDRMTISQNDFTENGYALRILGSCRDNIITENNFIDNTFDVGTNATRQYNQYTRNYWSEYTGYDLDKNGVGDVPYRPVKLFSFVVEKVPQAIVLLRSLFVDLMNFTEKVTPVFTPQNLFDDQPLMKPHPHDQYSTSS
ncbi:nitrous oxide reductase family maturation protein NosD [Imperialibacter roseus]|uniref:Nitrous oxide reductase family maturation protein NosD n=1 Tax=Imperialibacter roseus TaxID=1324217 RepID=A0ABZ0ILV4_9BACT|nr:nitrous oxide reductase family maturation protein NosD [Imperialibacter roseus]WOK06002.1 nitrous oxide reductase family maturation protein NosD [Imperialibacter roseus]